MTSLQEDTLQLEFSDEWHAIKFDEHGGWHRKQFGDYKAVDVLAFHQKYGHYWIEIKDCEGYEQDNQPRLSPKEPDELVRTRQWLDQQSFTEIVSAKRKKPFIVDELVEKIRDSLITVQIAQRMKEPSLQSFYIARKSLTVVLLLTWNSKDFNRLASRLKTKLDQKMNKYGFTCLVVNQDFTSYPIGMKIRRTP
jgi:hypothetical protein